MLEESAAPDEPEGAVGVDIGVGVGVGVAGQPEAAQAVSVGEIEELEEEEFRPFDEHGRRRLRGAVPSAPFDSDDVYMEAGAGPAGLGAEGAADPDVSLREGGQHLVKNLRTWFIPRPRRVPLRGDGIRPHFVREDSESGSPGSRRRLDASSSFRSRSDSVKIDVTFENAETELKRDLKRQYLALAIGCWVFLTVIQSVSLVFLNMWEYSPVVIGISIMALSIIFYWKYVWGVLHLPFKRLWVTPYPLAVSSAVLGSLAQHAMFLVYEGYAIGQLLIAFFLIQSFYLILVASTFRNYMARWQKFINHRRLCFDALQVGREKELRTLLASHDDSHDDAHDDSHDLAATRSPSSPSSPYF